MGGVVGVVRLRFGDSAAEPTVTAALARADAATGLGNRRSGNDRPDFGDRTRAGC
jgi:hypothetical protein